MGAQSFGEAFDLTKLRAARAVARDITHELASLLKPGMIEDDAHALYKELSKKFGVQKQWHAPKLRFGPNTLKNFREASESHVLREEDIFFIDIGPVIYDHEADYGETFAVGSGLEYKRIADCSLTVFHEVAGFWRTNHSRGTELYEFAKARAEHYGYVLNMGNDGHRIADFPHQVHFKGGLAEMDEVVVPNAWILEIHLWEREQRYGAFFEDILT